MTDAPFTTPADISEAPIPDGGLHQTTAPSTWRIIAGLLPMPLALLLEYIFSADASGHLSLVLLGHIVLWPYSLVTAIVAAFINEHIVNQYIKHSMIAVPVGTVMIGFVAAYTSGSHYAWATAFVVTAICRAHYVCSGKEGQQ